MQEFVTVTLRDEDIITTTMPGRLRDRWFGSGYLDSRLEETSLAALHDPSTSDLVSSDYGS